MLALALAFLQASTSASPQFPYLASEINSMAKVDQEIRTKLIEESGGGKKFSMTTLNAMRDIDKKDTERMKWVVARFGWPTPAMVGEEACGNAWLLVQHADADHPFQKQCLALIEPLARSHVIEGKYYAYLFDRVQVGDGKLQHFGTQGKDENGVMFIDPVEDPRTVDIERKKYGLTPLETYAKQLAEAYGEKLAPDWKDRLISKKAVKPKLGH
ncbi:MAG: hypothetical protein P4L46_17115 [Fimbriimonas sp.]|nr:hypothetical protein [Fimbriimonas sp.]